MSKITHLLFPPEAASDSELRAHRIYTGVMLTAVGIGIGLLGLLLSACADVSLPQREMLLSYFKNPTLLLLNLLPPVLFVWTGYFLFGRCWCGVLLGGLLGVGFPLVNYYKIALRGDPMLASDLLLFKTAKGIMGRYHFTLTKPVLFSVAMLGAALLFAVFLLRYREKRRRVRLLSTVICLALGAALYIGAYTNASVYQKTANNDLINVWSDTQVFLSRGFAVSFLHSVPEMFPEKPENYSKQHAQALLDQYPDAAIPDSQKVTVMGVMLEAFSDLTDFAALSDVPAVQEVYAPLHALEAQSLSGNLLTNIFAGGTVDTEWGFLTGESRHDAFRSDVGSYVRYFSSQGYATHYAHPGYGWFYNRENVNDYLGFEQSVFTENGFGDLVNPVTAAWHSDQQLVDYLLKDLDAAGGSPLFSFAVSYQNHGPYDSASCYKTYVSPQATGLSEESCNILNNYLYGVNETIGEYVRLTQELEKRSTPVVLVLFGDHKPWLGNSNSVYTDLGVDLDISTLEGFHNYYATPYLIWANSAAKRVIGSSFTGDGGEFSPCFLMPRLFDECGWQGSGFMQLSRNLRSITPLVYERGLFLSDGVLTSVLNDTSQAAYLDYLGAQYYREHVDPSR